MSNKKHKIKIINKERKKYEYRDIKFEKVDTRNPWEFEKKIYFETMDGRMLIRYVRFVFQTRKQLIQHIDQMLDKTN